EDKIVFVAEDDLWIVSAAGGVARRLTAGLGEASRPAFSPDGHLLAFTSREEGAEEVYVMAPDGGPARRVTYMGGAAWMAGWTPEGQIVFSNAARQPFARHAVLYQVDPQGGEPEEIAVGPALAISYGPDGGVVIGRNTLSPARWKRYRGGQAGQIWIDEAGDGQFRRLIDLDGNPASPMWIGSRIYFLSDHEGIGNLYSCQVDGSDLQRHTEHENYYARNAATDGRRIVYHAGGDLYLYDVASGQNAPVAAPVAVEYHSPRTQRNRKFVAADRYLDSWTIHPEGHSLAITTRGKAFTFANWEGAVSQHGRVDGPRYRLLEWLNDGQRLVGVTDAGGEESFVIISADGSAEPERLDVQNTGRPLRLVVNPKKDQVLFSNHRYELCLLDLESRQLQIIDRGEMARIAGFNWSPDGEWVAYGASISAQRVALKLWQAESGEITQITDPVLQDVSPAFDPAGKYLYFLSYRTFDPVYDNLHFELSFPLGMRPYLITLQKDLPSPFVPQPRAPGENNKDAAKNGKKKDETPSDEDPPETEVAQEETPALQIDLEGIRKRILAFPVEEGIYGRVEGIKDGRVIYSRYPAEGALDSSWMPGQPPAKGTLLVYDFEQQKEETLLSRLSGFRLSPDGAFMVYRSGRRLRVLKAGAKPDKDAGSGPGRKSGWIDLERVKVSVEPGTEWRQMYREAWRLQRDQFWTPDMSKVDWLAVYGRYLPLVERVASRSEFSDLMWEMQGELGTSHSYELGGDYRPEPRYSQGLLGAEVTFDVEEGVWRITSIVSGDSWDPKADSPLNEPGLNVAAGDQLLAVNGRRLNRELSPADVLVNQAGENVTLMVADAAGEEPPRTITVRTLDNEWKARYRQWVEENRRHVHEATDDRVGYIHIPDMGPNGYAEFHRGYLAEVDHDGLIVDVRFNGGGHVSQLILEKLARKRIGYDISRWGKRPTPYPEESPAGPLVALTNEHAGSDGDIFSHGFKVMGLGPLIGTRTWGGVIGIWPRHTLVDGTVTTQPEFSFWFEDVGWGVENYGTEPDIEVLNRPQDYAAGVDAQLERAIAEIVSLLEKHPPQLPPFDGRPDLSLPSLPSQADG
ncbi:MAG: PDZ domain-containing protein, partial [Chloroflexota bacterium]